MEGSGSYFSYETLLFTPAPEYDLVLSAQGLPPVEINQEGFRAYLSRHLGRRGGQLCAVKQAGVGPPCVYATNCF
ncbi:hypothetical protein J6590_010762 [Homalodisca vitripennis]|nr:hypothetical protein J6590_010762 [Homalodisca vitripennis]